MSKQVISFRCAISRLSISTPFQLLLPWFIFIHFQNFQLPFIFTSFHPLYNDRIRMSWCYPMYPIQVKRRWGLQLGFKYIHLDISRSISRWKGPISVALFVPDVEFSIAETFIEYLRNCYPAVKEQVDNECFHKYCHRQTGPRLFSR